MTEDRNKQPASFTLIGKLAMASMALLGMSQLIFGEQISAILNFPRDGINGVVILISVGLLAVAFSKRGLQSK